MLRALQRLSCVNTNGTLTWLLWSLWKRLLQFTPVDSAVLLELWVTLCEVAPSTLLEPVGGPFSRVLSSCIFRACWRALARLDPLRVLSRVRITAHRFSVRSQSALYSSNAASALIVRCISFELLSVSRLQELGQMPANICALYLAQYAIKSRGSGIV